MPVLDQQITMSSLEFECELQSRTKWAGVWEGRLFQIFPAVRGQRKGSE